MTKEELMQQIIQKQDEIIELLKGSRYTEVWSAAIRKMAELDKLRQQLAEAGEENSYPCKSCGKVFKESELNEYTFNGDRCSEFYCNECDAGGRQPR